MMNALELSRNEVVAIQSALMAQIQDVKDVSTDITMPFTKEAREDMKNILASSQSALKKMEGLSEVVLPEIRFKPGDERQFFNLEQ